MKKQHIVTAVFIVLILGLIGYKYFAANHPEQLANLITSDSTKSKDIQASITGSSFNHKANITVAEPVNPSRAGVIEIGSKGFNMFIVDLDNQGNWKIVSKEFGNSLAYEGFLTVEDVKSGLKSYLSTMTDKGVAGKHCHFVVSSGALKNAKTTLIMDAITKMGYVVNKVTAEQEGIYALRALLPKEYKDKGFVVDIGGGNTKISWYTNSGMQSLEGPGAKYAQNGTSDAEVSSTIKSLTEKVPANLREYCFIIGGVPMQLAKPNQSPRFQSLQRASEYHFDKDEAYLKGGLNIYSAIQQAAPDARYVFDWDANFSIGFLINLYSKS